MMATVREMLDLVKCKIRFTTYEGDYEGEVRLVSPISEKTMIDKIFFLPDRIYMGTLTFLCNEISNYVVLNRTVTGEVEETAPPSSKCFYESQKADSRTLLDDYDDSDAVSVDTNLEREYPDEEYVLKLPPGFDNIPVDIVTLDNIGEEFHQAVNHIRSETSIGVSLEGPKLGRHGIISWLCLSTSRCTFLFDVQELGKVLFEQGLCAIMEDPNIQKIIHDCREVSDCLFHMFNVRLVNVFDTQVADKIVTMQKSKDGKFNKHVDSLNSCLRNYLNVPEDFLYRPLPSQSYHHSIISFRLRPPKGELKDLMMKNVIYLRLLQVEMEQALLNPFRRAVEVYLQVLQCASDRELLLEPSVPDQLPPELVLQGIEIVRFKDHVEVPLAVASGALQKRAKNPVERFLNHCKNYETNKISDHFNSTESHFPSGASYTHSELKKSEREKGRTDMLDKSNTKMHQKLNDASSISKLNDTSDEDKGIHLAIESDHSVLDACQNSKLGDNTTIQNRTPNYSRLELDQLFSNACSKISFAKEETAITQIKETENSSEDGVSDDPWSNLRAEFSKYHHVNENDKTKKNRFIPAGQEATMIHSRT